jgi:transcriptional regulator with XRE-family HTH domain
MRKLVNLRELRERAALSQEELGELAGISKNSVGQLERGEFNPRPATVRRLAEALGVEPEKLWDPKGLTLPSPELPDEAAEEERRYPSRAQAIWESMSTEERQERLKRAGLAEEKIEAGEIHIVSDALASYVERRIEMYEEDFEDSNSPHFRSVTAATLWAEMLHREANLLTSLVLQESRSLFRSLESLEEKVLVALKLARRVAKYVAAINEIRRQADERIAAMRGKPDDLAQKRLQKARREADESERSYDEEFRKTVDVS